MIKVILLKFNKIWDCKSARQVNIQSQLQGDLKLFIKVFIIFLSLFIIRLLYYNSSG